MSNAEKLLYDAGGDGITSECARGSDYCPKLVYNNNLDKIFLIDRDGNRASMTFEELNRFLNARDIIVNKLKTLKRS